MPPPGPADTIQRQPTAPQAASATAAPKQLSATTAAVPVKANKKVATAAGLKLENPGGTQNVVPKRWEAKAAPEPAKVADPDPPKGATAKPKVATKVNLSLQQIMMNLTSKSTKYKVLHIQRILFYFSGRPDQLQSP